MKLKSLIKVAILLNRPPVSEIVLKIPNNIINNWGSDIYDIFFDKLNVDADWGNIGRAFYKAKCTVSLDEGSIILEFDSKNENEVRKIVQQAKDGSYGPDAQDFWSQVKES